MSEREPITGELRDAMSRYSTFGGDSVVSMEEERFDRYCDAIDAIHAGLERENAALKAELDRVLGEQEKHAHARGESITDELREWYKDRFFMANGWNEINAISDRIDAEHESACAEAYGNGVQSVALPDMTAYAKLPLDADGECIHIGDVMENIVCPSVHREVTGVGAECFYGWDEGNGRYSQFDANCYRHHHAPTVEDVLTEFGIDWEYEDNCEDRAALLAEYAAKLQLREDA